MAGDGDYVDAGEEVADVYCHIGVGKKGLQYYPAIHVGDGKRQCPFAELRDTNMQDISRYSDSRLLISHYRQ